jgi:hypothetical protein
MTVLRFLLVAAVVAGAAVRTDAHETWLLPSRFIAPAGTAVELIITSGMTFPEAESPIKPDRIQRANVRIGGKSIDLPLLEAGNKSSNWTWSAKSEGVAVIAVTLKPRSIELTEKQLPHYFEEIDASAEIRKIWADTPKPRQFRESYTKHAKSIIRVGPLDRGWAEPAGLGLELVPLDDPTNLVAGGTLKLRVLKSGKPFAGFRVGVQDEKGKRDKFVESDRDGIVTVRFAASGRCLLFGTDLRPPAKPGEPWTSDFTTLTVSVQSGARPDPFRPR